MPLILKKAQAQAVYNAMCALNDVDGNLAASFGDAVRLVSVSVQTDGGVLIRTAGATRSSERHANQGAFAAAYNLK